MTPIILRVQELREAKGWTVVELSKRAGIRWATLSAIEKGQTTGIDFATLEKLARALEVDPGYLIVKRGK
jgi:DNA-binding Xre family transcriptional regulator